MDLKLRISANFTLAEVLATNHRDLSAEQSSYLNAERAFNAARLTHEVLEPLRYALSRVKARPILVTSWLRSAALNKRVGGSASSQHLSGRAADIVIPGVDLRDAFEVLTLAPVGQRILYLDKDDRPLRIHVSIPEPSWTWNAARSVWSTKQGDRPRDLICYPHRTPSAYFPYKGPAST